MLKSNGDKASPSFKPFRIGKFAVRFWRIWSLLQFSFKHVFISATSFQGIPSSKRILYDISVLSEALLNIR
jgi:hypothetical protein